MVGAGVIGLAVAYELLRRRRTVVVCERDAPGSGASRVAAGMLAPTSEADLADVALLRLAQESLRRYPGFVADLEALAGVPCQYRADGTLWVALGRDDDAELAHLEAVQRAKGLAPRRLSGAEVLAREPRLSSRVVSGLWVPEDHQVDPRSLVRALATAVGALGGTLLSRTRVDRIHAAEGHVRAVSVTGPDGPREIECGAAVLAAGVWTREVAAPGPSWPVRPVKGQIVRLAGPPLLDRVIRHPRVYLVPRRDGELVVGATMEEQGLDPDPTAGAVMELLRDAWQLLPGIYDLRVVELAVGFRPAVPDHLPLIGAAATGGLFLATGHFRHGILLAPATGHHLAELIGGGAAPPELAPFDPGRLGPAHPGAAPPRRAASGAGRS
jgi:glycine oxidase